MSRMKSAGIPAGCYTKCVWPPRSQSGPGVLISSSRRKFLHRTAAQRAQSAAPNRGWPAREAKRQACRFVRAVYNIVSPRAARQEKDVEHIHQHIAQQQCIELFFLFGFSTRPMFWMVWVKGKELFGKVPRADALQMVRNRIDRSSQRPMTDIEKDPSPPGPHLMQFIRFAHKAHHLGQAGKSGLTW